MLSMKILSYYVSKNAILKPKPLKKLEAAPFETASCLEWDIHFL